MIKIKLTPNYLGFRISGTFEDFYELYDSIYYFIRCEGFEYEDENENDMSLHILGFLYELRHAYQGSRNIVAVDNGLNEEEKEYYGIKKSTKENIIYEFDYVIPDLIFDILIMKYFQNKKIKKLNRYDVNYSYVNMFYGQAVNALSEILTENQVKKLLKI